MGSSLKECGMVIQRGTLVKVALVSVGRGPSLQSPESWRHQIGSNSMVKTGTLRREAYFHFIFEPIVEYQCERILTGNGKVGM